MSVNGRMIPVSELELPPTLSASPSATAASQLASPHHSADSYSHHHSDDAHCYYWCCCRCYSAECFGCTWPLAAETGAAAASASVTAARDVLEAAVAESFAVAGGAAAAADFVGVVAPGNCWHVVCESAYSLLAAEANVAACWRVSADAIDC